MEWRTTPKEKYFALHTAGRWSWSWTCYFGLGLKNLVLFTSPRWWGLLSFPKKYKVRGTFGLDFRPFGPHSAASSNSLPFPQCIGVLIKTPVVPIFGAKECITTQDFVLKTYRNSGGRDPLDTRSGTGDICSHQPRPVPTCQMLVPLRFF